VHGFSYTDRSRTLGYWVVNGLIAQSNAEKAGLRNGDHITAINGRNVKEIRFEEQRTLFDGLSGVTLTIQRGDTSQDIHFEFDEPKI
jgi:C-terminal processing protease CtpA/Prc